MTDAETGAAVSGEARLKASRAAFIRYFAFSLIAGLVAGMLSGVAGAFVEEGLLPPVVLVAVWIGVVVLFAWFCRDYFRRVDELDLLDNLWASMIGLYTYMVSLGSWHLFYDVGLLPAPDQYLIAAITLSATALAYLARKAGWR